MESISALLGWFSSTFTFAVFIQYYPTLLNCVSLTCAYCLNNHKVTIGRWFGVFAALGWSSYGLLIDDYSFLVANIIFLWIYANALYKFNRKRDEYKATFEEQQAEIEKLQRQLDREILKKQKRMNRDYAKKEKLLGEKEAKLKQVVQRMESNLKDLNEIKASL